MQFYSKANETIDSVPTGNLPLPTSNLLLISAAPLLGLLLSWKTKTLQGSQDNLRTLLIEEFKKFVKSIGNSYPVRTTLALQYCLCAALDETIMHTQEVGENWAENTLLNIFYKETLGGERFYLVLDNMLENPQENANFLEVLYLILCLGFKGKNFNKDPLLLEIEQQNLLQKIDPYLSSPPLLLSVPSPSKKQPDKKTYFWFFLSLAFLGTLAFTLVLDKKLDKAMQPSLALLEDIFKEGNNR